MATRRRLTDDELFKLADEAHDRWGTVTVSALQHAAGGGSAARFKKIIAEWDRRRDKGAPEEPPEELADAPEPPPDDTLAATAATADRLVRRRTEQPDRLRQAAGRTARNPPRPRGGDGPAEPPDRRAAGRTSGTALSRP